MKTITIEGRDKDIYNILQENRIRVKRHDLVITGDTEIERPSVTIAKAAAKVAAKAEKEAIAKRAATVKAKAEKAAVKKEKEDKEAASRQTKEEKTKPETK